METGVFALIPRERLYNVLEALQAFSELPIQLIADGGELLMGFGQATRYCTLLKQHIFTGDECANLHMKAGRRAQKLGEAYIFSCHANLNHIAFPLLSQGELLGSIIVGPFLMDRPDSTLVSAIAEVHALSPSISLELYDELEGLKVLPPARVNHLKKLIDYLLSPLLPAERALLLQTQEKMYQQARLNETIQLYKAGSVPAHLGFFYEKEKALLTKARTGNIAEVKALLNDLIGHVLFSEGGEIDAVRTRAIELTTLLSRVAMDGGARTDSIYELNSKFLFLMSREQNLDDLCYLLQDVAMSFMSAMFSQQDKGNPHIRQALKYMAEHYSEPLTLETVAGEVGLSPNYFSALFKESVGAGFRKHLCLIRIEESKRLLLSTDYSLSDIALAMGFSDQSYYCKMFKQIVGLSPRQYRE